MYSDYLGFKQDPFAFDLDLKFFFQSSKNKIIFRQIAENIRNTHGILLMTGEKGIGKTMLMSAISQRLRSEVKFISTKTNIDTFEELVTHLCNQLGFSAEDKALWGRIELLEEFLSSSQSSLDSIILIVDDAHLLQDEFLNKLLLFSFALADKSTKFKIILLGSSELVSKIKKLDLLPLKQLRFFKCVLRRLELHEVNGYIKHRLIAIDHQTDNLFTPSAITEIAKLSKGKPHEINKICSAALLTIGRKDQLLVTKETVMQVRKNYFANPVISKNSRITINTGVNKPVKATTPWLQGVFQTIALGMLAIVLTLGIILFHGSLLPLPSDKYIATDPVSKNRAKPGDGLRPIRYNYLNSENVQDQVEIALQSFEEGSSRPLIAGESTKEQSTLNTHSIGAGSAGVESQVAIYQTANQSGFGARQYIATLKEKSQPVAAEKILDQAAKLNKQGMKADAYLLYFYLAKQGNVNAAFKLAQLHDPATFQQGASILDRPSIVVAKKWYKKAAGAGHPLAKNRISLLDRLEAKQSVVLDVRSQN